jgi:hypothetical protein
MNIENNKLIAEFMGCKLIGTEKDNIYYIPQHSERRLLYKGLVNESIDFKPSQMKYHESWEWLIPVVEKIESLNVVCFEKNLQEEGDYQCLFTKGNDIFICHYADTSKEATHRVVVEFIKWYNEREK